MQPERKTFAEGGKELFLKFVGLIRRGREKFQGPTLPNIYFSHEGRRLSVVRQRLLTPLYTRSLLESLMTPEGLDPEKVDYFIKSRTSLINSWVIREPKSLAEIMGMTDDQLVEKTDTPFSHISVGYFRQATNPLRERFLIN